MGKLKNLLFLVPENRQNTVTVEELIQLEGLADRYPALNVAERSIPETAYAAIMLNDAYAGCIPPSAWKSSRFTSHILPLCPELSAHLKLDQLIRALKREDFCISLYHFQIMLDNIPADFFASKELVKALREHYYQVTMDMVHKMHGTNDC